MSVPPSKGCTGKEPCPRIERVADRLFEGEETVLHVMREQIASEKRRNPLMSAKQSGR